MGNGPVAADELRLLIERVERLEEEKKGISDDIKDVYGEAKSRGFCTKTMKRIVALRKLKPDDRRELEAMLDLYKGALGMLDGTPLGNWAVKKLEGEAPEPDADKPEDAAASGEAAGKGAKAAEPAEPVEPAEPELTLEDAHRLGAEAARAGTAVTANPFPPRDPRRAAWDEAWCRELGSDGMDIPEALRPAAKKPKGGDPKAPGNGTDETGSDGPGSDGAE